MIKRYGILITQDDWGQRMVNGADLFDEKLLESCVFAIFKVEKSPITVKSKTYCIYCTLYWAPTLVIIDQYSTLFKLLWK